MDLIKGLVMGIGFAFGIEIFKQIIILVDWFFEKKRG